MKYAGVDIGAAESEVCTKARDAARNPAEVLACTGILLKSLSYGKYHIVIEVIKDSLTVGTEFGRISQAQQNCERE